MPTSDDTDRIRRVYDDLAPTWDAREALAERLLIGPHLRRDLGRHLRGEVLELGSGTGATLPMVDWSAVTAFTATDLSPGMLAEARRNPAAERRPVTFREVEAGALPFPDATFDTVTTSLMLCTVPDPAATLAEMTRVLRPGGRIVLLEHVLAPNRLIAWLQRRVSPWQEQRMGCHLDRRTDRLVRDLGYTVVHHRRRVPGIFHLMVLEPPSGQALPKRDSSIADGDDHQVIAPA